MNVFHNCSEQFDYPEPCKIGFDILKKNYLMYFEENLNEKLLQTLWADESTEFPELLDCHSLL